MKLNFNIPDFEQYTDQQQFVNVIKAIDKIETQTGGLKVEDVWAMANDVIEELRHARRPDATALRLQSLIYDQMTKQMPHRTPEQNMHSTHCVLFCVNYQLCANDEEPDPNQQIIDNINEALSQMPDIVELCLTVEEVEDNEEVRGNEVLPQNVLSVKTIPQSGYHHEMQEGDDQIVIKLEMLINKSLWINGYSEEHVRLGLRKALGLGGIGLTDENKLRSKKLWRLLRNRRNLDEEASFQMTWLNFVGWCLKHKLLSGNSPMLCKEYFPGANEDAYKAIDKSRTGKATTFIDVEPLLEQYIKKV